MGPFQPPGSEAGSQIAHHVDALIAFFTAGTLLFVNRVVHVLQVPVVDYGHHHAQSVVLSRSRKRVVTPSPATDFLFPLQASFQPHIAHRSIRFNKLSGPPASIIYHDDSFTYIKCAAREKPALYEIKDGKPNLISFQFENGVYIAPKIIDTGYLAVGKKKLPFARHVSAN